MFEEQEGITKSTEVNGSIEKPFSPKTVNPAHKENLLERSFGHLDDAEERQPRATRGADGKTIVRDGKTFSRKTERMTKAQKVAVMNEETSNIRQTSALMYIGVDATQGIALDELFGTKEVRKTTRMTRLTTRQTRKTAAN